MPCLRSPHSWRFSRSKLHKQRLVFFWRMRHDLEAHDLVSFTAELGADPAIATGTICLEPDRVLVSGDGIDLAAKARHPETMDYVRAGDGKLDLLAGGNVQHLFARRARIGIAERPHPAFAYRLDPKRGGGTGMANQPFA